MSKKEKLEYRFQVESHKDYSIKVRIGDVQDGDHNVYGSCPYENEPINDNPEWESHLGLGNEIKGKVLFISSASLNSNPHTNNVSVRVFINEEQVEPILGNYVLNIEENEIGYFNQIINFI